MRRKKEEKDVNKQMLRERKKGRGRVKKRRDESSGKKRTE